jgi:hypothetical protein
MPSKVTAAWKMQSAGTIDMITFDLIVKTYYKQKMLNLFLPFSPFRTLQPIPSNQFTQPRLAIHTHLSSIPLTILLMRENKVQYVNRI